MPKDVIIIAGPVTIIAIGRHSGEWNQKGVGAWLERQGVQPTTRIVLLRELLGRLPFESVNPAMAGILIVMETESPVSRLAPSV